MNPIRLNSMDSNLISSNLKFASDGLMPCVVIDAQTQGVLWWPI